MTSKMRSAFMLDDPVRHSLLAGHRFYVQQAKERLLSTFGNISAEADAAADAYWESSGRNFDPDIHDEAEQAEDAQNHGIMFYELLSEMHRADSPKRCGGYVSSLGQSLATVLGGSASATWVCYRYPYEKGNVDDG